MCERRGTAPRVRAAVGWAGECVHCDNKIWAEVPQRRAALRALPRARSRGVVRRPDAVGQAVRHSDRRRALPTTRRDRPPRRVAAQPRRGAPRGRRSAFRGRRSRGPHATGSRRVDGHPLPGLAGRHGPWAAHGVTAFPAPAGQPERSPITGRRSGRAFGVLGEAVGYLYQCLYDQVGVDLLAVLRSDGDAVFPAHSAPACSRSSSRAACRDSVTCSVMVSANMACPGL